MSIGLGRKLCGRFTTIAAVTATVIVLAVPRGAGAQDGPVMSVTATRLRQNPLITVETSASLDGNVNGPTVIRVPDWVDRPLGRYYMYFGHHMGRFIRMAYADTITGPWTVYEPGVLDVSGTAFFRPPPDAPPRYTHVASPEIFVDTARRRLVMWFHGWWTNGEPWPSDNAETNAWMAEKGYLQRTQVAESSDGIHFEAREAITDAVYLRVFQYGGYFYGLGDEERPVSGTQPVRLFRSVDLLGSFEMGPNPFRHSLYSGRVRHVTFAVRGSQLYIFFTALGDAPERVMLSTIDLTQDWRSWRATPPVNVLEPETAYECADLPYAPSRNGAAQDRVRQIRDPFLLEESGRTFLFYAICGEQGIAAAEVTLPAAPYSISEVVNQLNAGLRGNPTLAELVLRGEQDLDALNPAEMSRFVAFQRSRLNIAEYILDLEAEGASDLDFVYVDFTVNEYLTKPGLRQLVRRVKDDWPGSEELLARLTDRQF